MKLGDGEIDFISIDSCPLIKYKMESGGMSCSCGVCDEGIFEKSYYTMRDGLLLVLSL